uniref:NADH:ubiquinone reductase (H(+)-translocating) n=1 Tax=Glossina morsitans morsitans TaxID=37546 RepID=A0A1B0FB82_GLOMM
MFFRIFCLPNISYERIGRLGLFINKGILSFIPSISLGRILLYSTNILLMIHIYILVDNMGSFFQEFIDSDMSYNIYFENVKSSNAGILTAIFVLVLGANYERDINNIKIIQLNAMHALCMHYLRLYYLYVLKLLFIKFKKFYTFLVLAGFYSKDILEIISLTRDNFFFFSTGLPVVYSFRLVFYSIIGELNFFSLNFSSDEGWIVLRQKN